MKIAIITEGGENIGFGHITRCLGLYNAFKNKNITSSFIVNENKTVVENLKSKIIGLYKQGENSIKDILPLIKGYDCAIIDSYRLNKTDYVRIQKSVRLLVSIDDNKRIRYPRGILINGAVYAKDMNYPLVKGVTCLLGPEYMPMRPEFVKVKNRALKGKIENALITFGGDDSKNMTPKVRDFILSKFPDIRLSIVIGKYFRDIESFKNNKNKMIRYYYDISALDMIKLMQKNDIAISAGGQTLYELAAVGIPAIGICVADNQLNNLKGWGKQGFLENCGWYNSPYLYRNLTTALMKVKSKKIRARMKKSGRKIIDGKGAQRIVSKILEAIK